MSGAGRRTFVIDASVARAAGPLPDRTTNSRSSRVFLQSVLEICHHAVWTPELADEWNRHASDFARGWYRRMIARKKLDRHCSVPPPGLEMRIKAANPPDVAPEEISKDMHLVSAALAVGGPIVSLDEKFKRRLTSAVPKAPELAPVEWVTPSVDIEDTVRWLEQGALVGPKRWLGSLG